MVSPSSGVLLGHKKERTEMCHHNDEPRKYNPSERSQTQKAIYFKIPFKMKRSEYTNLGGGGGHKSTYNRDCWK